MSALITSAELSKAMHAPSLRLLDASWYMPAEKRNPQTEFEREHIPGARFFDIDAASDHSTQLPHMLPSAPAFERYMGELGITENDHVVLYDTAGLFSAGRVWWMLRVMGHKGKVQILSGGLSQWKAEGGPLSADVASVEKTEYHSDFQPHLLRNIEQVAQTKDAVIDARSATRFTGKEADPRPGIRAGHIPGSRNIPFRAVLTEPHGILKDNESLQAVFTQAGIDPMQPLTASCGSGVTACILALALYELGNERVAIYDGSWAEWGSSTQPVSTSN